MEVRSIGIDVHRDFCEVAIAEAGEVRAAGRIESRPEAIEQFAQSLASDDQVVMEATYGAAKIAKLIEPHVARVVICDARQLKGSGSRKTDRRDAKKLAEMLVSGYLDGGLGAGRDKHHRQDVRALISTRGWSSSAGSG